MSTFAILDEARDRFRPLRARARVHADAIAAYAMLGNLCARRLTDGFLDDSDIIEEFPHWRAAKRRQVVEALIEVGAWARVEGGYQFLAWDIEQTPADKERARREGNAARQRALRQRRREAAELPTERSGVHRIPTDTASKRVDNRPQNAPVFDPRLDTEIANFSGNEPAVTRDVTPPPLPLSDLKGATRPVAAPPSAPPPPIAELAKAKEKRTRRRTEADVARDRVVEIFNRHYTPRHRIQAVPGKHDYALLALLVQAYCPSGVLDEALVERSVLAYLDDPSWRDFGGYSLKGWAVHHARGLTRVKKAACGGFFVNR